MKSIGRDLAISVAGSLLFAGIVSLAGRWEHAVMMVDQSVPKAAFIVALLSLFGSLLFAVGGGAVKELVKGDIFGTAPRGQKIWFFVVVCIPCLGLGGLCLLTLFNLFFTNGYWWGPTAAW